MINAEATSGRPPTSFVYAYTRSPSLRRMLVLLLRKFQPRRGNLAFLGMWALIPRSLAFAIILLGVALPFGGLLAADDSAEGGDLVAHWRFKEGSGSAVTDSSGNGNNGAILPANASEAKWGGAEFNGAISFGAGAAHHVLVPASQSLNKLKKQITVIAHVYPKSLWTQPSIVERIWRKASRVAGGPLGLAVGNKNTGFIALVQRQWRDAMHPDLFYLGYGLENNVLHYKWHVGLMGAEPSLYRRPEGQSKPAVGEWVHLAGTYNGETGRMSLYVNGKLIGSETHVGEIRLDPESLNRPLIIGGELNGSNINEIDSEFNGYIDDVRIYNRALSDNEIDALALAAGKARH